MGKPIRVNDEQQNEVKSYYLLLVVIKQLSRGCHGDIQWVCERRHIPGQLARLTDKWLDDTVRNGRWQRDTRATVQC
jgi:hypothetical protein